ncbi:MAG: hypothetical protein U0230_10675 [Polyangiales bacterium]
MTSSPLARSSLLLLAFVAACGGSHAPTETAETLESPTHRIVLHRGFQPDQTYRFEATGTNRVRVSTGSPPVPSLSYDQTSRIELVARETVLETNAIGQAARTVYDVERLDVVTGDARRAGARPGQRIEVVAAERARDVGVTLVGGTLDPQVRMLLLTVLDVTQAVYTDDHLFGTLTPQSVGSWWSIDPVRVNEAMLLPGQFSGLGEVSGETTLVAMEWEANLPCARIDTELRIEGVVLAERIPNFTPGRGSLHARFSACYPIDARLHPRTRRVSQDFTLGGRVRGPNGYLPADLAAHVELTTTRTPLP